MLVLVAKPSWWFRRDEMWLLAASPAFVAFNSATGLNQVIAFFGVVWASNLWADLVFYGGTMAVLLLALRQHHLHPVVMGLLAVILNAVIYLIAATFMFGTFGGGLPEFFLPIAKGDVSVAITIGYPGILGQGVVAGVLSAVARRRAAPGLGRQPLDGPPA